MGLEPDGLVCDCSVPIDVATFWAAALGYEIDHDPDDPEGDGAFLRDPSGRTEGIYFQRVPEPKVGKNRVHLDLRPADSMAAQVERMHALGATTIRAVEQSQFWTVMADVEGDEFCVLMGPEDGGEVDREVIDELVIDAGDARRVADFWMAALGFVQRDATDTSVDIEPREPGALPIAFMQVPESKTVKNRLHLDVRPTGSMAEEVERVQAPGATVRGFIEGDRNFWTQMRDVEGNEFCVLRGPQDGWSPGEP